MTATGREIALLFVLSVILASSVSNAEVTVQSGPRQTHLLELYTSEGCSSCPPAERWLSSVKESPRLWKDLVPVSFHVDYWDGLGWKDFLAAPAFTARQRKYAAAWASNTVYTPCFVLDGREWQDRALEAIPLSGATPGKLRATLGADRGLTVVFAPTGKDALHWTAAAALLCSGLKSNVQAGENSGRTLQHDFAVLALESGPMESHDGEFRAQLRLPLAKTATDQNALAVWVTEEGSITPVQAAGGPL